VTLAEPKTQSRWQCAQLGLEIEFCAAALRSVCAEALLGLRKLAKGGLERGGLLFGDQANGLIRVLATRPIQCEHRFGPSFVLSDTDETRLQAMLSDLRSDPELAPLQLVGCYFSHSRHGAALTETDMDLCNRYFAQTGQIALILIPALGGSVRGTLLTRDPQGSYVSAHEFEYAALAGLTSELIRPEIVRKDPPRIPERPVSQLKTTEAKLIQAGVPEPLVARVPEPLVNSKRDSSGSDQRYAAKSVSISLHVTKATLLYAALVVLLCWPNRDNSIAQIPLSFTDRGRDLIIHWDIARTMVRDAVLGMMEVRDGEQNPIQIPIPPDILRRGWIPYERKSDIVRISFALAVRGLTIAENAVYLANDHKVPAPRPVASESPTTSVVLLPTHQEARAAIAASSISSNTSPSTTSNEVSLPATPDRSNHTSSSNSLRPFRVPLERIATSAESAITGSVALPDPPALRPDTGTASPLVPMALGLSVPAPRSASPSPASGWLIWTGNLPKRSMLSLSAQGASLGYLNGWIPQNPVHVEVHPAQLIEGGIIVFTKDQNLRSEAPNVRNGWNTVVYKQDYARATELEVIDSPGPANNWSQLILRNGTRAQSVIVLDWRTQ